MSKTAWRSLLLVVVLAGCRKPEVAPPPHTKTTDTWDVSDSNKEEEPAHSTHAVETKGVYEGRLDNSALEEAFNQKKPDLLACYQSGKKKNRYLEGELQLRFEITVEGKANNLIIEASTLGDDEVERCFTTLVNTMSLPKPVGGTVLAGYPLAFHPAQKPAGSGEPAQDERPKYLLKARDALKKCKKLPELFQVAMWIKPEGEALSVGYSAEDPDAQDARDCVVENLLKAKYPTSYRKATYLLFSTPELQELN